MDFHVERRTGEPVLLQVCADLSDADVRGRELRALAEAMRELRLSQSTIVTLLADEEVRLGRGTVRIVPAWRWLLEPNAR